MTIEERIEKLEAKISEIEGDLNYIFESSNPNIVKAIREIQEELAKDKNISVSSFIWRV
jgi:archaellum component FlaC